MISVPSEFISPLIIIMKWHLTAYMPEVIFDGHVERILSKLRKEEFSNCNVSIDAHEIYYIRECAANATNNIDACGLDKDLIWRIHDWAFAEYKRII